MAVDIHGDKQRKCPRASRASSTISSAFRSIRSATLRTRAIPATRGHKRGLDRQTVQPGTPDHLDETPIDLRIEDLLSQEHFGGATFPFLGTTAGEKRDGQGVLVQGGLQRGVELPVMFVGTKAGVVESGLVHRLSVVGLIVVRGVVGARQTANAVRDNADVEVSLFGHRNQHPHMVEKIDV
jgi:hypothetical protein